MSPTIYSSPPPTHYPYYSPPPNCNMTKPKPPPPSPPPNCNMSHPPLPPPSPPVYNCTCPPLPPKTPGYYYPPPPTPYIDKASPPPPPYTVIKYQYDHKAVIAVSVSLGGILVAFLVLGVLCFARLKRKPQPYPQQPSPPPPIAPTYNDNNNQYATPVVDDQPQTVTYQAIEIIEEAPGPGNSSYEPAPVVHDHHHGQHNYG